MAYAVVLALARPYTVHCRGSTTIPIRGLLADNQDIVRPGLATIMRYEAPIDVSAHPSDGKQSISRALESRPDDVLMHFVSRMGSNPAIRDIMEQLPPTYNTIQQLCQCPLG